MEQFYTDNANTYPASKPVGAAGAALVWGTAGAAGYLRVTLSPNNMMVFTNNTTSYVICATNTDGGIFWGYNSANGGSVHQSGTDMASCATNA
jgi:hypothetical protein